MSRLHPIPIRSKKVFYCLCPALRNYCARLFKKILFFSEKCRKNFSILKFAISLKILISCNMYSFFDIKLDFVFSFIYIITKFSYIPS